MDMRDQDRKIRFSMLEGYVIPAIVVAALVWVGTTLNSLQVRVTELASQIEAERAVQQVRRSEMERRISTVERFMMTGEGGCTTSKKEIRK